MGKILIVDDKTENLYLLQSLLETSDFESITARNGAEALGLARKNNPDLIISDILMPVMDGFTLCRECKKDKDLENIPFFFYTATYTDSKDEEYALSLGAEQFIRKPIEPDDFIKIINEFYKKARKKKSPARKPVKKPESVVLKEYNEVLVRKIEYKMLQAEKAEQKLREYSEKLEKEIIERKTAEESLRNSQSQLTNALRVAHLGPWEYDVINDQFIFNDLFYEIFRTNAEKVGGYTMKSADYASRFVHPEDASLVAEEIRKAMETDDPDFSRQLEHRIFYADGEVGYINVRFSIIKNKQGETVRTYGVNQDITERKKMENKIIESETYYRTLFEGANDAIFIMSEDTFIECNEKTISMFECNSKEDIINHYPWEFSPTIQPDGSDSKEKASDFIKTTMKGKPQRFYWKHIRKNGEMFDAEVSLSRIKYGEKIFTQALVTDISDRKKTERDLILAKEKAEESDRLKTAFLHNISHEIRTPMNAIIGFSSLLSEPGLDEHIKNSFIATITQSSDQLLNIINDIIEISNFDAGTIKISKSEIEINSVIKNLFNQFKPMTAEKDLKLCFSLPLADSESILLTDESKFIQIISNLLDNAFKFTQKGKIDFGYDLIADHLQFYVSDTGIGIPENKLDKIFDRFYQIDKGMDRQYEGTGLGLSICKAYVSLMGGNIWVSSTLGTRTTFYFTIPFIKPIESTLSCKNVSIENDLVFPEKKKILIVEDIDSNYKLIAYFLKGSNIDIIRANNGIEAVDIVLSGKRIDLVFMDIRMPEMDGYTATRRIREAGIKVPVIAQTAYADDREKAIESGCSDIISKPFDRYKLLTTLVEYLE